MHNNMDVNDIFNVVLNTYLQIFYYFLPKKHIIENYNKKSWITTGVRISSKTKGPLLID